MISPGGIEAWVVHEPSPLIALEFAFEGGSAQDPPDKPGLANLAASLWDDGAGDLDAKAFHSRLENKSIGLSFSAGRDHVRGSLRTLTINRDEAFDYLRLALTAPRFDTDAVERARAQLISRLQRQSTSPNDIASRTWWQAAFPGPSLRAAGERHARIDRPHHHRRSEVLYPARAGARPAQGGDRGRHRRRRCRARCSIAPSGRCRRSRSSRPVADVVMQGLGRRIVVPMDVPQAVVTFGTRGIGRGDPDFMAAYIVNYILGGGAFSSRLYQEVREKRGLAYGVYDSLTWFEHAAVLIGGTATRSAVTGASHRHHRAGDPPARRGGSGRAGGGGREVVSRGLLRARARHLAPRSPARSCRCSSTISASIISTAAPA